MGLNFWGGGGTPIFSYMVGSGHFGGFKFLNFNILGVFRQMNIFGGKILWIFFRGHHKIGLYLGVTSMHFNRVFS